MTHINHIPRSLEVVIDLDILMEDVCIVNNNLTLTIHQFNKEVVPTLREMHQYFRIKKINIMSSGKHSHKGIFSIDV